MDPFTIVILLGLGFAALQDPKIKAALAAPTRIPAPTPVAPAPIPVVAPATSLLSEEPIAQTIQAAASLLPDEPIVQALQTIVSDPIGVFTQLFSKRKVTGFVTPAIVAEQVLPYVASGQADARVREWAAFPPSSPLMFFDRRIVHQQLIATEALVAFGRTGVLQIEPGFHDAMNLLLEIRHDQLIESAGFLISDEPL